MTGEDLLKLANPESGAVVHGSQSASALVHTTAAKDHHATSVRFQSHRSVQFYCGLQL